MRRCCRLLLLLLLLAVPWRPVSTDASPSSGVELRFSGYPGLACADGRYPLGQGGVRSILVVLLVVDADNRIHRTFGCFFEGDIRQLQAMATEHELRFISLLPASVSLAIPEADCVVPRPGLPSDVFDVQMNLLGAAAAPAGCLMYASARAGLASRGAGNATASDDATAAAPADGALLLRFQRVSFPALECRFRTQVEPDVILQGLVQPPDDHFNCAFRYRIKGEALGAMLRYLAAAYRLPLDTTATSRPMLTLRPFMCGAGAGDGDDADVDFVVTGRRGRSTGCKFSPNDQHISG